MLSAAWLREHNHSDPALDMLRRAYMQRGVSQGHWLDVIASAKTSMEADPADAFSGFVASVAKSSKNPSLISDLKAILEERNRSAHGARPHNRAEAAVRVAEYLPLIERVLHRASFLARYSWALVDSVAFSRQQRVFIIRVGMAMNDHPEFELRTLTLGTPLANDTFYVLHEKSPLDLTPFLVIRYCELCRQPEVCYSDRVYEDKGVSLKSLARGHQIFDAELVTEFIALGSGMPRGDKE
ncbi:MAG: hypothetical protein ACXVXP_03270 [Mycobacteriaceae bacterium]